MIRFSKCPGKDYYAALQKSVEESTPDRERQFLESLNSETSLRVTGSAMIATSIANVDGKPHVFLANFAGLQGGINPIQTPQTDVQVTITGPHEGRGFFLPFLGEVQQLSGAADDAGVTYRLPPIAKGAVFWYEP